MGGKIKLPGIGRDIDGRGKRTPGNGIELVGDGSPAFVFQGIEEEIILDRKPSPGNDGGIAAEASHVDGVLSFQAVFLNGHPGRGIRCGPQGHVIPPGTTRVVSEVTALAPRAKVTVEKSVKSRYFGLFFIPVLQFCIRKNTKSLA